jgi:pimeloyl-ACP methyl ester carboxylesterase
MTSHVTLPGCAYSGGDLQLEYAWVNPERGPNPAAPLLVFLHEGLGSVAMWKSFPQQLCHALCASGPDVQGLVYSREGYGHTTGVQGTTQAPYNNSQSNNESNDQSGNQSGNQSGHQRNNHRSKGSNPITWPPSFMHHQAQRVLPALVQALNESVGAPPRPVFLVGHSDGASIALLAARCMPNVAGVLALSPHTFVEAQTVQAIEQARALYDTGRTQPKGLRSGLARYHADVDGAFDAWSGVWLSEAFRSWDIRPELNGMRSACTVLQGLDDPYGSTAHADSIKAAAQHTCVLYLEHCGHDPHRDAATQVVHAAQQLLALALDNGGV